MAAHSRIQVWEIPCIDEPGGLQSIGLQRVDNLSDCAEHACCLLPMMQSGVMAERPVWIQFMI